MSNQSPPPEDLHLSVVEEIASREGISPLDLPPLYDSIDSTNLDSVLDRDDVRLIEFTYCGYEVTVDGEGHVTIDGSE